MKGKATISLSVEDILRSMSTKVIISDADGLSYFLDQQHNNQKVRLSFTYRFGKTKATKKRNVGNLEETSRVGSSNSIGASSN